MNKIKFQSISSSTFFRALGKNGNMVILGRTYCEEKNYHDVQKKLSILQPNLYK